MNDIEVSLKTLLLQGLGGDARAYHEFLSALAPFLRGFLRRRLQSVPDEVEDLVQEILLAVHNQRASFEPSQPVTAWLHAIARYKYIDLLRRRSRVDAHNVNFDDEDENALFARDERDSEAASRDVDSLLASLPDKQRLPIVHVKLEGRSVSETARLLGMGESAVKVAIHRGLKALAARMREEGV